MRDVREAQDWRPFTPPPSSDAAHPWNLTADASAAFDAHTFMSAILMAATVIFWPNRRVPSQERFVINLHRLSR